MYLYTTESINMINLIGAYECKVDDKGRLMLPAAFKKQLAPVINDGFVIKRNAFQRCLELYPMPEWQTEISEVNKLNRFEKKNQDFIRIFMAGVKTLELDSAGRLLIPKDLISHAKINRTVVLSSSLNRIEIWDKELYESVIENSMDDYGALTEDVMGNSKNANDLNDVS